MALPAPRGRQPPYPAVLRLIGWALQNWNHLDGWSLHTHGRSITGLGTRGLTNLAYTYRLTERINTAIADLDERAAQAKTTASRGERSQVIRQAVTDFDYELELELAPAPDVTIERVVRARSNARALEGLRAMMTAAAEPSE